MKKKDTKPHQVHAVVILKHYGYEEAYADGVEDAYWVCPQCGECFTPEYTDEEKNNDS